MWHNLWPPQAIGASSLKVFLSWILCLQAKRSQTHPHILWYTHTCIHTHAIMTALSPFFLQQGIHMAWSMVLEKSNSRLCPHYSVEVCPWMIAHTRNIYAIGVEGICHPLMCKFLSDDCKGCTSVCQSYYCLEDSSMSVILIPYIGTLHVPKILFHTNFKLFQIIKWMILLVISLWYVLFKIKQM